MSPRAKAQSKSAFASMQLCHSQTFCEERTESDVGKCVQNFRERFFTPCHTRTPAGRLSETLKRVNFRPEERCVKMPVFPLLTLQDCPSEVVVATVSGAATAATKTADAACALARLHAPQLSWAIVQASGHAQLQTPDSAESSRG